MAQMLIAVALFALTIIPPSHAADPVPERVVVAYGDLDLNTATGYAKLKDRLQNAAAKLCAPVLAIPPDSEPSIEFHRSIYRACVGRLSERAMAGIVATRR